MGDACSGDEDLLIRLEISQISTGTELTMLEANVEPDSPWWENIVFPNYDVGYSAVGTVVAACNPSAREGSEIMKILSAIYKSAETGKEVTFLE